MSKCTAFIIAILCLFSASVAQNTVDDSDVQSWNDLQVTAPLTKHLELQTVMTIQFSRNLSVVDNTRFGLGVTAKLYKNFSVQPFMTFLSRRNSQNQFRYEYRPAIRAIYRMPFKHFSLSHRSQFEYRIRPGRNTWRYRPSITFEKGLPKKFVPGLKMFVTEEPFYDSASGRFSRNRISAGINKTINKKFSVDLYYLYQGDNFSRPSSINVIGTVWRVKL